MSESASLNENERARAERMRAAMLEQTPGARPLIASLVAAGLIEGWRNVTYVGTDPGPQGIASDILLRNSRGM